MSKGSQTTTQQTSTSPPGYVNDAYKQLVSNTNQLAQTPYTPYGGEGVAPINQQQYQGIADINQYALSGIPLYQQAAGLIGGAAQPLNPTQIQQYYSPYQQNVIDTTQQQFNEMNKTALNNIQGNAAAQGALGGDRSGVAQAAYYQGVLPGQEQTIAGLENTGYANALATAGQQFQQNPLATAFGLGNVASGETNTALQGASAVTGAGTMEQQTSQALDQYLYNQYLALQGYPLALNQYAAGIDTGIGSAAGGTSYGTTTAPPPSMTGQIIGAAGTIGGAALLASDRRLKEGISKVGKTKDGQPIYRFRYKGDPVWHIGLMAQDVEKKHPEAVLDTGPYKMVDIKRATDTAARRYAGGGVGGYAAGGSPSDADDESQTDATRSVLSGLGLGGLGSLQAKDFLAPWITGDWSGPFVNPLISGNFNGPMTGMGLLGSLGGGGGRGYALGGTPTMPYPGASAMPYAGGPSYIPAGAMARGPGPPRPPSAPQNPNSQSSGGGNMFSNALSMAKMAQGSPGGGYQIGSAPAVNSPTDLTGSPGAIWQTGGRVNLPMRAGMGMPSFVRGYQDGGSPFDPSSFESTDAEAMRQHALDVQAYNLSPTSDVTQTFSSPRPDDWAPPGDTPQMRAMVGAAPEGTEQIVPSGGGMRALGFSDEQPSGVGGGYQPPPRLPPSERPSILPQGQGLFGLPRELGYGLMAAGLQTMAAASRPGATPLGAVGEGGLGGLKAYSGLKGKEADIEMESRKLDQAAQNESDRIKHESEALQQQAQLHREATPYQKWEMGKPVPTGTAIDQFGNRIQTYGTVGPDGVIHPVSDAGTAGQPGTSTMHGGIDSSLTGEEYLKQFPPETQAAVKDYLAGRTMPTGNPRTGPAMMIKQIAQKYGADIGMRADDAAFAERRQMKTDLARTSPQSMGGQLTFAGTAISHLADGAEAMVGLNNYDTLGIPGAAWAINKARGAASTEQQGAVNRVNGITQHYGQEVTKFYANSPGGEAERSRFNKTMDTSQSPVGAAGSVRAERDLIPERTQQQYANMVHVLGQQEADAQISRLHVPEQTARINASLAKLDPNGPEARGIKDGTIAPVPVPAAVKNSADVKSWAQQNRVPSGYPIQLPDGSAVRAP